MLRRPFVVSGLIAAAAVIVALALVIRFVLMGPSPAAASFTTLSIISGTVEVQDEGASDFRPAEDGETLEISVTLPGREVFAEVWRVNVGRIHLYLLNANIEKNSAEDREITAQLYGGDLHNRIKQEIRLGIGGIRALYAMGCPPATPALSLL